MFDYGDQALFLRRFQGTLEDMLAELHVGQFTLDEIVTYYHSLSIIQDFTLIPRYNYNISVAADDIGIEESKDEGEEGERE
jgi:hypothetical protein